MSLAPGTRLGPYEIVLALGAGGMGEVYRARDSRLDRDVAIKVLPAGLAETPELRERLEREARAISSLNHPHICTLHDIGRENGVDFLVLELLEGETLMERLVKRPAPRRRSARHRDPDRGRPRPIMSNDAPRASDVRRSSPPALDELIRSCLAKTPADRRQSVHDLKLELQRIRDGKDEAPRDGKSLRPMALAVLGGIVLGAVLSAFWVSRVRFGSRADCSAGGDPTRGGRVDAARTARHRDLT